MHRLDSLRPEAQLGMAWMLASRTGGVAPVVNQIQLNPWVSRRAERCSYRSRAPLKKRRL